jgi:SAM-dependent methyltransferase
MGNGLEIGAMHNPTPVGDDCHMEYFDVVSRAEAMALFPELPPGSFKIEPQYLGNLDTDGLSQIQDNAFDFVILNHVIEHVANPIRVVADLFRVVRVGGNVVISCPDMRFTFDKNRKLTDFEHLRCEFDEEVTEVTDEHYVDFLAGVHPEVMDSSLDVLARHVDNVRRRREHAHVWDSESFRAFLLRSIELLNIFANCIYEVNGETSRFEYFGVWKRNA